MIELRSSIEEVRVYRSGAEIKRIAEITRGSEDFPAIVAVVGLPLALDDGSVRVRVETSEAGSAPVAQNARVALDASLGERVEMSPDERAVRSAREQEEQCRANVGRIEGELVRIESAPILPRPKAKRGERPSASPTAARIELGTFVREQALALATELATAREALERAAKLRAEAEALFARASSSREAKPDELRKAVVVALARSARADGSVEETTPSRIKLIVTYVVPGARWAPAYTLRVTQGDGAKRDVELSMRAVVCQRTGEDWSGVRLSLSTANAMRWTELPELKSLRVGRAQAGLPKRGWRPLPAGIESLFEDFDRASALTAAEHRKATPRTTGVALQPVPRSARETPRAEAYAAMDLPAAAPPPMAHPSPAQAGPMGGYGGPPPQSQTATLVGSSFGPPPGAMPQGALSMPRSKSRLSKAATITRGGGERFRASEQGEVEEAEEAELEEELDVVLRADARMLGFGSLRMASPRDSKRGTLTLMTERESYLELSFTERSLVHIDIGDVLSRASARAREVTQGSPPARHTDPGAVDGFDHAYDSESPADVPSDGVFHSIPILTTKAEARMHYVTVPRESRDVFRYAEIPSALDAPLLAGPLEVYVGRDYLLSTDLSTTPPRGKIKLGLGVDSAIKVARNTDFTEQVTGLMRGSLDLKHQIRIEVANNKSDKADIEIRERLPSVRDKEEDIRVEIVSVEPRWEAYEQDESKLKGGYTWRVAVDPGKKVTLQASYVVRIAGKNELVGGNRRES